MSDQHLVEQIKRGDRDAARELVQRYYPSVLRFLTTLCPNSADAEELTQEAFVKAMQGIRRFRGKSGLRTWLHRIAFHEFTHHRRRQRSTVALPESMNSPLFEANSILALDLERVLMDLSEEFRAAFVLCDIQELTMEEASVVLSVPLGTVKSRLHTARKRLQTLLQPEQEVKIHV